MTLTMTVPHLVERPSVICTIILIFNFFFLMYVFVRKTLWLLVKVTLSEVTMMDLVTDFTITGKVFKHAV